MEEALHNTPHILAIGKYLPTKTTTPPAAVTSRKHMSSAVIPATTLKLKPQSTKVASTAIDILTVGGLQSTALITRVASIIHLLGLMAMRIAVAITQDLPVVRLQTARPITRVANTSRLLAPTNLTATATFPKHLPVRWPQAVILNHIRYGRCTVAVTPSVPPEKVYNCTICSITYPFRATFFDNFLLPNRATGFKTLSTRLAFARQFFSLGVYQRVDHTHRLLSVAAIYRPSTGNPSIVAYTTEKPTLQKSHVVFVYRQSNYISSEFTRTYRDTHIATSRRMAEEIQRTRRADIQSIAVIGSQSIKGTFVPSFAASQGIETKELCELFEANEYSVDT